MLAYLTQMSDLPLFLLLSIVLMSVSITAVYLIRRFVPAKILHKDDVVIGHIGSLTGIIYGVLVGLMALYLINNINYTAAAVQRESSAAANIYRDSKWLKEPARASIQASVKEYIHNAIDVEWPEMEKGLSVNHDGDRMIDDIARRLSSYTIVTQAELLITRDLLEEIKILHDARQQRIHMIASALTPDIWLVIIVGTILTLGINYLFGINLYLHIITVSAASLMCASMIFLLLTLDCPFQGEFIVEPDAFRSLLTHIENQPQQPRVHT